MLSGQIGRYKYYELKDMYKSAGCRLCGARFSSIEDMYDACIRCPVFMAVKLTKLYAEQLYEYEWRYEDDGK